MSSSVCYYYGRFNGGIWLAGCSRRGIERQALWRKHRQTREALPERKILAVEEVPLE